MGVNFGNNVEVALYYLYYGMRNTDYNGKKGIELLEKAMKEGDPDAPYFLARCYGGPDTMWEGLGFEQDDDKYYKYLARSIDRMSDIAILTSLNSDQLTKIILKKIDFKDFEKVFQSILKKADRGEAFCQYAIGKAYANGDILKISDVKKENFETKDKYNDCLKDLVTKSIEWYEKAFDSGMFLAGTALHSLYENGKGELFSPSKEKAEKILKRGAECKYPNFQIKYGEYLYNNANFEEAIFYFTESLKQNNPIALGYCGNCHQALGNYAKAYDYFSKSIDSPAEHWSDYLNIAQMIYEGKPDVPSDYKKAILYFEIASESSPSRNDMLADLILHGKGCEIDVYKAYDYLKEFMNYHDSSLSRYLYGIYLIRGFGIFSPNLEEGIHQLESSNDPRVQKELSKYKKNIFGKWSLKK